MKPTNYKRQIAELETEQMLWQEFLKSRQQQKLPTTKKGAKKKKSPQRTEFELIVVGSLILFFIGYYFCRQYGLIT